MRCNFMGMQRIIYNRSPILFQHVLTSMKGYQLKFRRYNKLYYESLDRYISINNPFNEQEKEISKLLLHLKHNVPFYKNYLDNTPDSSLNIDVLKDLPTIEKEDLRRDIKNFTNIKEKKPFVSQTGGTTGKSLNVYSNKLDSARRMAYLDFFKQQHGAKPFSKRASFTGQEIIPYDQKKSVFWRYNHSIRQMLYSGFHVSEKNIPYYVKSLNKFKPVMLDGFPSSIYRVAKYINLNNIKLEFQPIAIFPTAETLLDHHKQEMEKAFKCPVRNQYASSEGAPFITECISGNLHMNIETGYFKLEPVDLEKELYELIVTSFLNYTTPIVQYRIGDIVKYYDNQSQCDCGNMSPYVKEILGRQTDYLVSELNGKITSVSLANIIRNAPNSIISCQFKQKNLNEVIVSLVVDESKYSHSSNAEIINALKYRFGENIKVRLNFVREIEKEKSGKTLFVKNLLKDTY